MVLPMSEMLFDVAKSIEQAAFQGGFFLFCFVAGEVNTRKRGGQLRSGAKGDLSLLNR